MEYHIPYDLDYFQEEIDIVKEAGFNPTKVTQLETYTTFVFKTKKESDKAYMQLEFIQEQVSCNWYGEKEFQKIVKKYEKEFDIKVKIFKL